MVLRHQIAAIRFFILFYLKRHFTPIKTTFVCIFMTSSLFRCTMCVNKFAFAHQVYLKKKNVIIIIRRWISVGVGKQWHESQLFIVVRLDLHLTFSNKLLDITWYMPSFEAIAVVSFLVQKLQNNWNKTDVIPVRTSKDSVYFWKETIALNKNTLWRKTEWSGPEDWHNIRG